MCTHSLNITRVLAPALLIRARKRASKPPGCPTAPSPLQGPLLTLDVSFEGPCVRPIPGDCRAGANHWPAVEVSMWVCPTDLADPSPLHLALSLPQVSLCAHLSKALWVKGVWSVSTVWVEPWCRKEAGTRGRSHFQAPCPSGGQ